MRVMDATTRQSFEFCRRVTRSQARNFYYGLKLTPEPKRSALYAIYALMRACDDLVDEPAGSSLPTQEGSNRIEAFRAKMQAVVSRSGLGVKESSESIWPAVAYVANHYPLNPAHLHAMLDGQQDDLSQNRYPTFDDLYQYCYKVASTVGLVCVDIWGVQDAAVYKLAEYRGIALQLTNILRDIAEDYTRGRVYLPLEDLQRFAVDIDELGYGRKAGASFDRLMAFEIERAKTYYEKSAGLEEMIASDCRPTSLVMMRIYRSLLDEIAKSPRRVLVGRVRLSTSKKLRLMMGAYCGK